MLAKSLMEVPGYTWRDVLRVEALICIVGTLPLGLLFYRGRPELYGLLPDAVGFRRQNYSVLSTNSGSPKANSDGSGSESELDDPVESAGESFRKKQASKAAEADAHGWSARDALCTVSLWSTCGGVCLIACISMGVWFHLPGMVTDATPGHLVLSSELSTVLGVQTAGQMVAKFAFSWLLDRFSVRVVLLSAIAVQVLALGIFSLALQLEVQLLAVVAVGLQAAALGGAYSVDGVSYAKFFGRNSLGSITGATKACWQVATAIGPTPLGLVRDYMGTFVPALGGAAALCVLAFGVVFAYAKRPSIAEPCMLPCFHTGHNQLAEKRSSRLEQPDAQGDDNDEEDKAENGRGELGLLLASKSTDGETNGDRGRMLAVEEGELERLRNENAQLRSEPKALEAGDDGLKP
eukprot:COSAG02_NODE_3117_length_7332_cov_12.103000_4_plen_407_part_00